jgi:crotonobetainyl-CoA:carnitine CoA-transferase CaiB-like acyl-CoA transferase
MDLFVRNDVGADPFLRPEEFLHHPDMTANGRVVRLAHPDVGPVVMPGPLVHLSATPARIDRPAPGLGADDRWLEEMLAQPAPAVRGGLPERCEDPPLAGVTILEAAYFVAGPLGTALLAELGARVIKVEPISGDPYRRTGLQAVKYLHGKESLAIDLKSDEGRRIVHDLVARSDCFVHSFRPGVTERLGLDFASLSKINAKLLYLYAASYGSAGPQRGRTAFHSTPNALAGGGIAQAGVGNPPVDDSYPDPGSALAVATALLLSLYARQSTGVGQYVETTMLASTAYLLSPDLVLYEGGRSPRIADHGQHGLSAWYRLYRCADRWIFLAALRDVQRERLATLVDGLAAAGPDDADGPIAAALAGAFATRSAAEWSTALATAGIPAVVASDQGQEQWLEAAGLLEPAYHPDFGDYWRTPPPICFSASPTCRAAPARLGQHNRQILRELGYPERRIDELTETGVLARGPETDAYVPTGG